MNAMDDLGTPTFFGPVEGDAMPLTALLVMNQGDSTWRMEMELPFPPFPGMGIRVDVYEILNVCSVVVGDPGYDVTCIVELEGTSPKELTPAKCVSLGFRVGAYP